MALSQVLFLILAHLGVGIAFTLLLVSKEAGVKFFRFNGGLAAVLSVVRGLFDADPARLRRMVDEAYRQNECAIDMDACARPLVEAISDATERDSAPRVGLPALRPADRATGDHRRPAAADPQPINVEA